MTDTIGMIIDGKLNFSRDVDPAMTLLDYLRNHLGRTGTKEGCAEGDCGACTVLVGQLGDTGIIWRTINSCIAPLAQLDGCALLTVEDIGRDDWFSSLRQNLVNYHGFQCGFCAPGFVVSLAGRAMGALGTNVAATDLLSGNLCRCTGYGGILAAAGEIEAKLYRNEIIENTLLTLEPSASRTFELRTSEGAVKRRWFSPNSAAEAARLAVAFPEARFVAGATDLGVALATHSRRDVTYIALGNARDLGNIDCSDTGIRIGAAVRIVSAAAVLSHLYPGLTDLLCRFGSVQVRNAATVVGNIANGSPVGDLPPALIALGAELTLRHGDAIRYVPLDRFYLGQQQDRLPGEFIESVFIPAQAHNSRFRVTKLSKRNDCDIASVCGAFSVTVQDGKIVSAIVAFGGMANRPLRASACEAALVGSDWSEATAEIAAAALTNDFKPWSDVRGSALYRQVAAANLVRDFFADIPPTAGRLLEMVPIDVR